MSTPVRIVSVNQDSGIDPQRRKGAAVHLGEMRAAFRQLGAEVETIDSSDPQEVSARLAQLESVAGIGMIYERYALGAYAAGRFARERGLAHVLEVNAPLSDEARRYRPEGYTPPDQEAERELFQGARVVLAVSDAVADFARERGSPPERIAVWPNGVDCNRFQPLSADHRERLRGEQGCVGPGTSWF